MNTIILKNSTIGDNVIIGAGSIVSGIIESNSVYAGNPARKLATLDEYYNKRKNKQIKEMEVIRDYYELRFNSIPEELVFREYFWTFSDRRLELNHEYKRLIEGTGYGDLLLKNFSCSEPILDLDSFCGKGKI